MGHPVGEMDMDSWREVINGPQTINTIATLGVHYHIPVVIGWTDGRATHHDLLFAYSPQAFGRLQGGLRGYGYLFVSVMRMGAFGFEVKPGPLHPDYVAEKLHVGGDTAFALAVLISGVMARIIELQQGDPNAPASDGLQEDQGA